MCNISAEVDPLSPEIIPAAPGRDNLFQIDAKVLIRARDEISV